MSTRCTLHFHDGDGPVRAIVYRHMDGYPDGDQGVPADFSRFLEDVAAQTADTRFTDPGYLAAKYVVWQAGQYARDKAKRLGFLSVGVLLEDPGDIEFRYHVRCKPWTLTANARPSLTYDDVYAGTFELPAFGVEAK